MAQNDFKSFAVGAGANVTPQADWEAQPALITGFQSGKASSEQINKAIRQASFIAAALAQYTSNKTGGDVLDDGDQAAFITKMAAAFGKDFQPLDATLTALAALTGAADKLPYFNGDDTAALTALTAFAREILAQTDADGVLSKLGLGNLPTFGAAASKGVASNADMQTGTSTDLLPTVAAVMSLFSKRSFSTNDSIRIPDVPGGLIIQWGEATTSASGYRVNFPKAYPNQCIGVIVCDRNSFSSLGSGARDLTGFNLQSSNPGTTLSFFITLGS